MYVPRCSPGVRDSRAWSYLPKTRAPGRQAPGLGPLTCPAPATCWAGQSPLQRPPKRAAPRGAAASGRRWCRRGGRAAPASTTAARTSWRCGTAARARAPEAAGRRSTTASTCRGGSGLIQAAAPGIGNSAPSIGDSAPSLPTQCSTLENAPMHVARPCALTGALECAQFTVLLRINRTYTVPTARGRRRGQCGARRYDHPVHIRLPRPAARCRPARARSCCVCSS